MTTVAVKDPDSWDYRQMSGDLVSDGLRGREDLRPFVDDGERQPEAAAAGVAGSVVSGGSIRPMQ